MRNPKKLEEFMDVARLRLPVINLNPGPGAHAGMRDICSGRIDRSNCSGALNATEFCRQSHVLVIGR